MWGIIGTIIIGFFAGLIARAIHSGDVDILLDLKDEDSYS